MALHIVHFIGPINHNSASAIRNNCLQALQNGATEIELHMSSEGGNMTAGFALYFFLKSLPACVSHVRLVYRDSWADDASLAGKIQNVDWDALGRVLEAHEALVSLELGVWTRNLPVPNFESLVENPSAQTAVLGRLPARLRPITVFV